MRAWIPRKPFGQRIAHKLQKKSGETALYDIADGADARFAAALLQPLSAAGQIEVLSVPNITHETPLFPLVRKHLKPDVFKPGVLSAALQKRDISGNTAVWNHLEWLYGFGLTADELIPVLSLVNAHGKPQLSSDPEGFAELLTRDFSPEKRELLRKRIAKNIQKHRGSVRFSAIFRAMDPRVYGT